MNLNAPNELDVIALVAAIPAEHAQTGGPLTLLPGQVGTIVLTLGAARTDGAHPAYEVEFVDERDGHTYAIATVPLGSLVLLRYQDPAMKVA